MVDKMEATRGETINENSKLADEKSATKDESLLPEHKRDPTTATGSPTASKERDGSVVSAMTDPASLEGNQAPRLFVTGETVLPQAESVTICEDQPHDDVPKQVILDDNSGIVLASESPPPPEPMLVTTTTPVRSNPVDETVSLPERPPPKKGAGGRSVVSETADSAELPSSHHNTSLLTTMKESDDDGSIGDYIRSPVVQNAIVERSPGGRYIRFMEKLGSGASKDVFRAYDTTEGIEVAWNVVNLAGVPKSERNRIVNEVRLLERLHHHNIISFHGSWVNRERQEVNFVTEILSSGTLKSFIKKVQVIRWKIAKRWALQILKGLEYLHSQDPPVIHRDLKCENIFINGTSGDLRIGDLGLSTVHRNGRVLSVLGTPEFMAPDMYEENSYDLKVDVYAFGMVMLEIFTKEIPYAECKNPAQIYKKVSAGEPPEVLSRLQSKHARDFVKLCLGYRDDDGNFIRPTVFELLKHPFLDKRENDDDEVVVDPPLRERTINETGESAQAKPVAKLGPVDGSSQAPQKVTPPPTRESSAIQEGTLASEKTPPQPRKRPSVQNSPENEEDGDRFEEMQESEISMRKVKVLMGRGQELQEQGDTQVGGQQTNAAKPTSTPVSTKETQPGVNATPSKEQPDESMQYLVAAAVIALDNPNVAPYADDILKLVVTLPVDGQTQNVQFDFHLVRDDPVSVAREMVSELGIPQDAVLEISGTISKLARDARMKQGEHAARFQQRSHGHVQQQFQQGVQQNQHLQHQHVQHQGNHEQSQFQQQPQGQQDFQQDYHVNRQRLLSNASSQQELGHSQQGMHSSMRQVNVSGAVSQQDLTQFQSQPMQQHQASMPNGQQQDPYRRGSHSSSQSQQVQHPGHTMANAGSQPQQHHMQQHQNPSIPQEQQQQQYQQHAQQQSHHLQQPAIQEQGPYHQAQPNGNLPAPGTLIPQMQPHVRHMSSGSDQQMQIQMQGQQGYPHNGSYSAINDSSAQHTGTQPRAPLQQAQGMPVANDYNPSSSTGSERSMQGQQQQQVYSNQHAGYNQGRALSDSPIVHQAASVQGQSTQSRVKTTEYAPAPTSGGAPLPQIPYPATTDPSATATQNVSHAPHNSSKTQQSTLSATQAPPSPAVPHQAATYSSHGLPRHESGGPGVPPPPQQQQPAPYGRNRVMARDEVLQTSSDLQTRSPLITHRVSSTGTMDSAGVAGEGIRNSSDESDSGAEEGVSEELRKLDEDFQKNLQRAQRVFDSRMENLQRSQVEREVQHQKTLEKHEKERVEFEKRLAQEAEQQNKRLEQLQKDWDKRRETMAQHTRKQPQPSSQQPTVGAAAKNGTHHHHASSGVEQSVSAQSSGTALAATASGHLRTPSIVSNLSVSPAMSPAVGSHKSPPDYNETGAVDR